MNSTQNIVTKNTHNFKNTKNLDFLKTYFVLILKIIKRFRPTTFKYPKNATYQIQELNNKATKFPEHRQTFMQNEFIRKLYNGGLTIKNRFVFQKGSIEEESEDYLEETTEADSDNEEDENDPKKTLLKRIDSSQQSPPPIQLILHDMNETYATFL